MPHVTETLREDHEKVKQLFKKLKDTTDGSEKTRQDLCTKIKDELQAHTEFEEEVFYPALKESGGEAAKLVDHSLKEHQEVEQMLSQIEGMDPTSSEFMDMVGQLESAVLEHVQEEETEMFPLARDAIEDEEAQQMSREHDRMVKEHMQAAH